MKKIPHVVIVGNGFGGVYTAKYLAPSVKKGLLDVTIIGRTNYFLFTPLLHEVATGGLTPTSIIEPLQQIFRGTGIRILQDEVSGVHLNDTYIEAGVGRIKYDYLVLSTGAGTNYRGIKGAEAYTFGLKTVTDAYELRNHVIKVFERLEVYERNATELIFVIVGGGPTGIELATELEEFVCETLANYYSWDEAEKTNIKIKIIASSSGILSQGSMRLRKKAAHILAQKKIEVITGEDVCEVKEDGVILRSGTFIQSFATIWAAGVEPIPPTFLHDTPTSVQGGRLCVDEHLRLQNFMNVFALGDVAAFSGTTGSMQMPMLAQTAVQEAKVVAENIMHSIEHTKLTTFVYYPKGFLVSMGRFNAVGDIYGLTFSGPFMWWLWRTIYLFKFVSWRKRFKIMSEWTVNLFSPRDISTL